jgi:hypothetical protein
MAQPNSAPDSSDLEAESSDLEAESSKARSPEELLRKDWQDLQELWQQIIELWPKISPEGVRLWDGALKDISMHIADALSSTLNDQQLLTAFDTVHEHLEAGRSCLEEAGRSSMPAFVNPALEGEQDLQVALFAWPKELALDTESLPDVQKLQQNRSDLNNLLKDIVDGWNDAEKRNLDEWQRRLAPISIDIAIVSVTKQPHTCFEASVEIGKLWRDLEDARGHLVKGSYYENSQWSDCKKEILACQKSIRAVQRDYRLYIS